MRLHARDSTLKEFYIINTSSSNECFLSPEIILSYQYGTGKTIGFSTTIAVFSFTIFYVSKDNSLNMNSLTGKTSAS